MGKNKIDKKEIVKFLERCFVNALVAVYVSIGIRSILFGDTTWAVRIYWCLITGFLVMKTQAA